MYVPVAIFRRIGILILLSTVKAKVGLLTSSDYLYNMELATRMNFWTLYYQNINGKA
jgi:hypothetical protein